MQQAFTSTALNALFPAVPYLLAHDISTSPSLPIPLDGFPDILLVTASSPHGGFLGVGDHSDRTPALLFSAPLSRAD